MGSTTLGWYCLLPCVNNTCVIILVYLDRIILHAKIKYTIISLQVNIIYVNG